MNERARAVETAASGAAVRLHSRRFATLPRRVFASAFGLRALERRFQRLDCPQPFSDFLPPVNSGNVGPMNPAASNPQRGSDPLPPRSYSLPLVPVSDLKSQTPPKDWPHAPVHRLADNAVYFITAGTLHKRHLFDTPAKRDRLEGLLLSQAKEHRWQLEAWAVFANHYHIVARGNPGSTNLGEFVRRFHGVSAHDVNARDGVRARPVWFDFRDTKLTHQHSYLARLN